jgi:predicted porin
MKKTLVAIAAIASVTGAMADVSITGHLDQALTVMTGQTTGATTQVYSGLDSLMSPSFLVFSGNEDIGGGLKAGFHIENGLNMNSSSLLSASTAWNAPSGNNRESWASLGGEFGEIRLGKQYTPLFLGVVGTDPAGANNAAGWLPFGVIFNNGAGINSNATTYISPSFSGFSLSAQSVSGANNSNSSAALNGYGYSLSFASGGLNAAVAVNSQAIASAANAATSGLLAGPTTSYANTHDLSYNKATDGDVIVVTGVGVSYDLGVAKISYLNLQGTLNSDTTSTNTAAVSVPMGAITLGYSYSSGSLSSNTYSSSKSVSSTGQQGFVSYAFSKRTSAYLSFNQAKNSTYNDSLTTTGLGLQHSF